MNKLKIKYAALSIFIACLLMGSYTFAQTKAELREAIKMYEGKWVNKKTKRHLTISFDIADYATINDWHGKWSQDNNTIDAYKAFVYRQKLIMPEDNEDMRAPYCEILKKGNALIYRCQQMDSKDKRFVEEVMFIRE